MVIRLEYIAKVGTKHQSIN